MQGEVDLFSEKGLYNGLFLMSDARTGTYWNHLTGEALYGPLAGERLEVENVLHTTVAQALEENPRTLVAISTHPNAVQRSERGGTLSRLLSRIRSLNPMFTKTMAKEDDRRPTMDVGIGIWNETVARYYAMETVNDADRTVLDSFEGKTVLVYYDPTSYALAALYTGADRVWWEDDVLHLSTGERIEKGVLLAADGTPAQIERPLQVFTRWYGFSLTFPQTEVYEQTP